MIMMMIMIMVMKAGDSGVYECQVSTTPVMSQVNMDQTGHLDVVVSPTASLSLLENISEHQDKIAEHNRLDKEAEINRFARRKVSASTEKTEDWLGVVVRSNQRKETVVTRMKRNIFFQTAFEV